MTSQAVVSALMDHPRPDIIHSDQGNEYTAKIFQNFCISAGINISMPAKGSPWQNGYQESFKSNKDADIKNLLVFSKDDYIDTLKNHRSLNKKLIAQILEL